MTSRSFVFSVAAACALVAGSSPHSPAAGSDAGSNPPLGDINLPVEQGKLGGMGTSATTFATVGLVKRLSGRPRDGLRHTTAEPGKVVDGRRPRINRAEGAEHSDRVPAIGHNDLALLLKEAPYSWELGPQIADRGRRHM
jgi:hypothetical protein